MMGPSSTNLLSILLPQAREWIESAFPPPILITGKQQNGVASESALYLYLQKSPSNYWSRSHPFTDVKLGGSEWNVLYIGQTRRLTNRHDQHIDQRTTCKDYKLWELIPKEMSVNEIDMKSDLVAMKFQIRQQEFPVDKNNREACRNSIGWSLTTHFTYIECVDIPIRTRMEEALIAIV